MARLKRNVLHDKRAQGGSIPEHMLAGLWKERASRAGLLRAADGRRFWVLYPGRRSTSAGPDFRNAIFYQEGLGQVTGDVEIHVNQRDWRAHGHHKDPRYNSVTLHVVYAADTPYTPLPNGTRAPVVSLRPLLGLEVQDEPCNHLWGLLKVHGFPSPVTDEELARTLDRAGDERFLGKSHAFESLMSQEPLAQVLYAGLMEGLGYSQNREPFLELAYRMPYATLLRAALRQPPSCRTGVVRTMLRQKAGFHPPPTRHNGAMEAGRWHLFRVRPGNHPRDRIEGAASLISRYLEEGLVEAMLRLSTGKPGPLEKGLTIVGDDGRGRALIGHHRARDLAVNVVLPFVHALACRRGEVAVAEACLSLYHEYPKLQENEVTREMRSQLMPPDMAWVVNGARRQQGLIHLQRLLAGATHGQR